MLTPLGFLQPTSSGGGGGITYKIRATFDGSDNTTSPVAPETGAAWTQVGAGVWGNKANRAYLSTSTASNNFLLTSASGSNIGTLSIDLWRGDGFSNPGLIFRYQDTLNFWALETDGATIYLGKYVAGAYVGRGTVNFGSQQGQAGNLAVVLDSNGVKAYFNDNQVNSVAAQTDTFNLSSTLVGIFEQSNTTASRFKNLLMY